VGTLYFTIDGGSIGTIENVVEIGKPVMRLNPKEWMRIQSASKMSKPIASSLIEWKLVREHNRGGSEHRKFGPFDGG
jgi:hypothetical protein